MKSATPIPSPLPTSRIHLRSSGLSQTELFSRSGSLSHIDVNNDVNQLKQTATHETDGEKHQIEEAEQNDMYPKQVQRNQQQHRSNIDSVPNNVQGMSRRDLFGSMVSINEDA